MGKPPASLGYDDLIDHEAEHDRGGFCCRCSRPATKLCDFVYRQSDRRVPHLCSQPLCDRHATTVASQHWHGRDEHDELIGGIDTVDYCPIHAAVCGLSPKPAP